MRVDNLSDYFRFWAGGICYVDGELSYLKPSDSEVKFRVFNVNTRKWPAGYSTFSLGAVDLAPFKVEPGFRQGTYVCRRNTREYRYVACPSNTIGWEAFIEDPLAPIEDKPTTFLGYSYEKDKASTTG